MSTVKEEKTIIKEVTVAWQCDACGEQTTNKEQYEQEWHSFSESHESWGSDSGDSLEWHDVCSIDCFMKQLQESIPALMEYADRHAEIADMPVKFAQKLLDRLLEGKSKENNKDE
jgi:hypothetical protein